MVGSTVKRATSTIAGFCRRRLSAGRFTCLSSLSLEGDRHDATVLTLAVKGRVRLLGSSWLGVAAHDYMPGEIAWILLVVPAVECAIEAGGASLLGVYCMGVLG